MKLKATRTASPKCQYDAKTNTYYDRSGDQTTKENYIMQCTPRRTCEYDSTYDVYFGGDGNIVSRDQYIAQCVPKCIYDSNKESKGKKHK